MSETSVPEGFLEQGFGPKLSRVAAGVCFFLFLGVLDYLLGPWVLLAIVLLPLLLALLAVVAFPKSSRKVVGVVLRSLDIERLLGWLEERFENLTTR
jgi:hypothetical protein